MKLINNYKLGKDSISIFKSYLVYIFPTAIMVNRSLTGGNYAHYITKYNPKLTKEDNK